MFRMCLLRRPASESLSRSPAGICCRSCAFGTQTGCRSVVARLASQNQRFVIVAGEEKSTGGPVFELIEQRVRHRTKRARRRRAPAARCSRVCRRQAAEHRDRPHLLPGRSEGRHHQADCEARRVRRLRSCDRGARAGRQESHHGARVPRRRVCGPAAALLRFHRETFSRPSRLRQHGDGLCADVEAGRCEGRDRARDLVRQPGALPRLRHPSGPDAAPFLGWRASITDEQWVTDNAADDDTWYAAVRNDFGLDARMGA